jgi:hypothetical protein
MFVTLVDMGFLIIEMKLKLINYEICRWLSMGAQMNVGVVRGQAVSCFSQNAVRNAAT